MVALNSIAVALRCLEDDEQEKALGYMHSVGRSIGGLHHDLTCQSYTVL